MSGLGAWVVVALVVVGAFFVFVGSFGLAKLSEFLKRLHGPTKSSTLGVGCILIASIVHHALLDQGLGLREAADHRVPVHHRADQRPPDGQGGDGRRPSLRPKPPAGRAGATEPAPERDRKG